MKHQKKSRRFGRKNNVRLGFIRSLAINLIDKEQIKTTEARAKALRPYIEKLITSAKNDDIASRRIVSARLGNNKESVDKLFKVLGPKFKKTEGGYTRIVKMPPRAGDAAKMAIIEFVK